MMHAVWQVPALERWTNLETLVMDWCDLLNHLTLSLPRLRKISLQHCKMLTSVSALPSSPGVSHSGLTLPLSDRALTARFQKCSVVVSPCHSCLCLLAARLSCANLMCLTGAG